MFCFQCEQTAGGLGCVEVGNCGKDPTTAALQDLLVHVAKSVSRYAHRAREMGVRDRELDLFVIEALFTTVTNVNFDPERVRFIVGRGVGLVGKARTLYEEACKKAHEAPDLLDCGPIPDPGASVEAMAEAGRSVSVAGRMKELGNDAGGLLELFTYGLKGAAAYAHHAHVLGRDDDAVYAGFHEGLRATAEGPFTVDELTRRCLWAGELNFKAMGLLDAANTGAYGDPVPTSVRVTPVKGKAIAVSGHDLLDLAELLKQTEGKGVNVYTHGEMLPAHGYPKLKAYKHLVGNYGGAWQVQAKEFRAFPGAVLMTTNCIQRPAEEYKDRIFTSGLVAWPGVRHIADRNFAPAIDAALAAEGFAEDAPEKTITVGFGHAAILANAGKVIDAVKAGKLRRIFLIGGCDGAMHGRNYYTELAEAVPKDCLILTLACGKYRFNKLDFGTLDGLPRLLDVGQCNDAYSAILVAAELAKAFGCGLNDLPLSLVLSWYEQKAVAILLTLLHLGLRNIRLGPTLPAFVSENVLNVLVEKFNLAPTTTAENDLAAILG